jgi:glucokinase
MLVGAIDAGGTKVLVGVLNENGGILSRRKESVPTADVPAYFAACARMLKACATDARASLTDLAGIGMNIPGMVTPDGHIFSSPSAGWGTFEARPLLIKSLGLAQKKLFFENDINACALAERRFAGAGNDFVWLTVSTGNGGAVVANGRLVRGHSCCAGEFGHIKVVRNRPYPCGCGGKGCLEAHASGVAIKRRCGGTMDAKQCEALARAGNKAALKIYEQTGEYIGRALAAAANLLNPEYAYIGGGVSNALDLMLPAIQRTLKAEAVQEAAKMRVVRTGLGYEAGLLGAAAVCLEGLETQNKEEERKK